MSISRKLFTRKNGGKSLKEKNTSTSKLSNGHLPQGLEPKKNLNGHLYTDDITNSVQDLNLPKENGFYHFSEYEPEEYLSEEYFYHNGYLSEESLYQNGYSSDLPPLQSQINGKI